MTIKVKASDASVIIRFVNYSSSDIGRLQISVQYAWFLIKRHMEQEQLIMPHYHMHMHGRLVAGAAAHECQSNQH